jgi:hypothetical protein
MNPIENIPQECNELKNLKYKSMFINGISFFESQTNSTENLSNLDIFLENEKNNNINEPWSKLDKTMKIKKLLIYAELYKTEKNLNEAEFNNFILFLKDCLDRKKLQRVKDVVYDKTNGIIKEIPGLFHNKIKNHFTIKNVDKRVSTSKSLAPKKMKGTVKNIIAANSDTESDKE